MAEVDTSSYLKPQQPQNPLDQILKVRDTAGALGDIEVGKGVQQAIQPDGSIDRNVLAQILKGSVAGSMAAPKAFSAIEALRNAGHAADEQAVRSQMAQVQYVASQLSPLYKKKGGVSYDELVKLAGPIIANGTKLGVKGTIPSIAEALQKNHGVTDIQRGQWVDQHYEQGIAVGRQFEAELPRTTTIDDNGNVSVQPAGTQKNPRTFDMKKQLAPGQKGVDDREYIYHQTTGQKIRNPNYGQEFVLGAGGGGGPDVTDTGIAGKTPIRQFTEGSRVVSREPTVNAATGQPMQSREAARANSGASSMPTSLPPGSGAPLAASGEAYAKDLADSRNYGERMNPLRQAIPLLEKLGKSGTGPGQETIQHIKAFAQTFGIPTINQKTVTDYAEAKKYLSQNAAAVAPPGTNIPSVLNAFEANPNMGQPQQAAVDLSKMLYGLGRMRQASVLAFKEAKKAEGLPDNAYTDWASEWSKNQDPRAYMADLMSPEERTKLSKAIKPGSEQAKKFKSSVDTAQRLKLFGDVERPEVK